MNMWWIWLQLECRHAWRRYRLLVLALVFMLFGLEAPLMAKLTPEILKAALNTQLALSMPKPTSVTAWQQFYKDFSQLGIFILAIAASGMVASEVKNHTLMPLVVRGLKRPAVLLAKYTLAVVQWLGAVLLTFLVCWGYTAYYFPDSLTPHPLLAVLPALWFGLAMMAIVMLGSSLTTNGFTGFLFGAGFYVVTNLINLYKLARHYNPASLLSDNLAILQGKQSFWTLAPAYGITLGVAVLALGLACWAFKRRRL